MLYTVFILQGGASATGPHHGGATQTGQGMALFMDIIPQALRPKALAVMAENARSASNISGSCQGGGNVPARALL